MILVTGGTGFVGRAVVRALLQTGFKVRVLARDEAGFAPFAAYPGAEFARGDVTMPDTVPHAARGAKAVIHLVGIIAEKEDQTFENVHVDGTRSVLAAAKLAGVRRFIHMSALGTRHYALSKYHRSKWQAEELVRQSGLEWTIFRPSLIYGPGDGFVSLFARLMRPPLSQLLLGCVPCIAERHALFQPIPVESVAQAFVRSLGSENATGKTYDLCGVEKFSLDEMLAAIARAQGLKPTLLRGDPDLCLCRLPWAILTAHKPVIFHFPPWLALLKAKALAAVGINTPLTADTIQMLREGSEGDAAPAIREFGLAPQKFHDALASFLSR